MRAAVLASAAPVHNIVLALQLLLQPGLHEDVRTLLGQRNGPLAELISDELLLSAMHKLQLGKQNAIGLYLTSGISEAA